MSWSISNLFRSTDSTFKRQEENLLMLEQYLSELEARYVRLASAPSAADKPVLDEAGKVIAAYRAFRAGRAGERRRRPCPTGTKPSSPTSSSSDCCAARMRARSCW